MSKPKTRGPVIAFRLPTKQDTIFRGVAKETGKAPGKLAEEIVMKWMERGQ